MVNIVGSGILAALIVIAELFSRRNGNGRAKDRLLNELHECLKTTQAQTESINKS